MQKLGVLTIQRLIQVLEKLGISETMQVAGKPGTFAGKPGNFAGKPGNFASELVRCG